MMERLLSKKMALETELNNLVVDTEDIEKKVAEYREQLYASINKENEEKAAKIKAKLDVINELIDEEMAEAAKAEETVEDENDNVVLQINKISEEESTPEEEKVEEEEPVTVSPVSSIFR